jgi:hypothetical protein
MDIQKLTIEDIEEKFRIGQNSPHDLADMRGFLAAAYSWHTGQLQEILGRKPRIWVELRQTQKSDKATDRAWEATKDGLDEMNHRLLLKRIEKLMGATNSLLRVAEGEARNLF